MLSSSLPADRKEALLSIQEESTFRTEATMIDGVTAAHQAIDLMLSVMSDGLDHPELWALIPSIVAENPLVVDTLLHRFSIEISHRLRTQMHLLSGLAAAAAGAAKRALDELTPLCISDSQNVQVQGVLFYLEGLLDPGNPKHQLAGKACLNPFIELDVLESSTHLCCASYLPTSTGNLADTPSQQVWNGDTARAIRASIFDGSYRFCNKRTCPKIQGNQLQKVDALQVDPKWSEIFKAQNTVMPRDPEMLNLSYDRTCNLSCPSCRTSRYAADDATRARFDSMQEREILPLLKAAKTVIVTGSGDPFASKNFRRLLEQLDADEYPELRFIVMTNGMLFTPRQWDAFPSLHRRVASLRISLDAATGPTHELLRRGARWPVMEQNLKFAGELRAKGMIEEFVITFIVQAENYKEMGDAVDLAHQIGASNVCFAQITNWGTFSPAEYEQKAIFLPSHPEYAQFVTSCQDARLRDPIVWPSDLDEFFKPTAELHH